MTQKLRKACNFNYGYQMDNPGFFSRGVTCAFLRFLGTSALLTDSLIILVIAEVTSLMHCLRTHVGMGSSPQDLFGLALD
jgi:hypothetical protein